MDLVYLPLPELPDVSALLAPSKGDKMATSSGSDEDPSVEDDKFLVTTHGMCDYKARIEDHIVKHQHPVCF